MVTLCRRAFGLSPNVVAQAASSLDVGDEHLLIDFGVLAPAKVKPWVKACKALGRALTIGHGPWGVGFSSRFPA